MKGTYNLDSGFLFLYDWMTALKVLTNEELGALFRALIARQKDEIPLPEFENPTAAILAEMIEPTIKRRLEGQKAGLKSKEQASKKHPPEVPPPLSRAKESKEKKSRAVSPSEADTLPKEKNAARAKNARTEKYIRDENFDDDAFFTAALIRSYGFDPREEGALEKLESLVGK